ncbi:MAG: hypothetical protein JWR39_68 [Devosia sp.]|nr:hypothetical protein [Devosia sp.]
MHLVLLGDSILDNGAYVARGGAVAELLQEQVGLGARVSLLARDGAVMAGVLDQLRHLPGDATHLVISAGGNDALRSAGVLQEPAGSVAEALGRIEPIRDAFARNYSALLDRAGARQLPTALCTIYDVQLPDPTQRRLANLALALLNDVITREAVRLRWPVIDLRVLFGEPGDYANAIEPSAAGARKIAVAAAAIAYSHDFGGPSSFYG